MLKVGLLGWVAMHAIVGDRLHVHGRVVGASDQASEIIEIRGQGGAPPYLVRRDDGQEALVFPGTDAFVEHTQDRESS
jgi:hypothetical protein